MKAGHGLVSELCFAAEGLSGTAAASSLRRLGSIMELAPSGRLFEAISTLSDLSAKASLALEEGSRALDQGDDGKAAARIGEALAHMDGLAARGLGGKQKRRAAR